MAKKPYGYLVSGSRVTAGRFCKTMAEAEAEMRRQMRTGARESGISEVWDKKQALRLSKRRR